MKNNALAGFIATAGLLSIGSLSAEAVTFTYNTNTPVGSNIPTPQTYNSTPPGGATLTVNGFKDLPTNLSGDFNINFGQGLGIEGPPNAGNAGQNNTFEEAVELVFPSTKTITNVTFGALGVNRDFEVSVDGAAPTTFSIPGDNATETVAFNLTGSSFLFSPLDNNDLFRIRSVDVVPEPLTILGTGLAIASMPVLKKTHKKTN